MKIFISCSNQDKEIADILMAYFERTFNISYDDMYNCFVGKRTPVGINYNEYIKESIIASDIIIILITEEALKSKYCLCELGAAWGLNKKTIMVFVEPTSYENLFDTPMAGMQALSVNLKDKKSIDRLIVDFGLVFSSLINEENYKSDQSLSKHEAKEDLHKLSFTREIPKSPVLLNSNAFHANGDPTTLKLREISHSSITARIDFHNSKPQFVGFFIDLENANWSGLIFAEYILSFSIKSTTAVRGVTIEFKNKKQGEELFKFSEHRIDLLKNNINTYSIALKDINTNINNWKNMKELVFLFTPDDVDEVGSFTLCDLEFRKKAGSK